MAGDHGFLSALASPGCRAGLPILTACASSEGCGLQDDPAASVLVGARHTEQMACTEQGTVGQKLPSDRLQCPENFLARERD